MKKTAILLFSNYQADKVSKRFRLDWSHRDNARVAEGMLQHSLKIARESKLPFYWIGAEDQQGDTFGEKLSQAYQRVFSEGYENVIAIGDDCPDLSCENLLHSAELLESGKAVIGPARDGGVYLIGLARHQFESLAFGQLAWTSDHLEQELQKYLRYQDSPAVCLVVKSDIDTAEDFKELLRHLEKKHLLWKWLKKLLDTQLIKWPAKITIEDLSLAINYYIPRPPPLSL